MPDLPVVIGYKLEKAKEIIGNQRHIIIEETSTPYDDKKLEREANTPIVLRQKETEGEIILTVSKFR